MTYVLVWLAVTATAVFVAAAAVGSVRDQVTETPTAMIPTTSTTIGAVPDSSVPTSTAEASTTTTTSAAPTTTTPTTTPTTVPSTTTTTRSSEPSRSTTTTAAPTTTTKPPATEIRSYDLVGGVVTVEVGSDTVHLAGASPKSRFSMDVEDSGPRRVEVEFKSDDHESKFSGEFEDGRFVPKIEESDRDDD